MPSEPEIGCGGLPVAAEPSAEEITDASPLDLPAYCQRALPGAQVFRLRARRDTVLVGAQGTLLLVPADAFDLPAGSGPVQLELREFYRTADIVLAGLGTRAGHDLLETGGMLHLAATAGGQPVQLRTGKRLRLQLPTRRQLPGMRLYAGSSTGPARAPDWHLAGPGGAADSVLADPAAWGWWTSRRPPLGARWPAFVGDQQAMLREFDRLLPASRADQAYLRQRRPTRAERLERRWLGRANQTAVRHAIQCEVELDSLGRLQAARQLSGDSVLAPRVLAALRQLPALRPASFLSRVARGRRRLSGARGYFVVLYTRAGQQLVGFRWQVLDQQVREEMALTSQRYRAEFARRFNDPRAPLTFGGGLYYELSAGSLGWINCDRLLKPGPRIQFTVATPDSGTVVSLVFQEMRSILASSRTEGGAAVFEGVPVGQVATVVALRRAGGVTYLATAPVSLGAAGQPALDFRPVSLAELRTALAQL